jgi:glycogen debranching enzyme
MEDRLIIVDGATFVFSSRNGDVAASKPEGFFYEDVRHLSRWCLTVDGKPLTALRRGTSIRFRRRGKLRRDRAVFDLRLGPGESWDTCVDVAPVVGRRRVRPLLGCDSFGEHAPELPLSQTEWLERAPELDTDWDPLRHIYEQSLLDLAALRIRPREEHLRHAMPAGGLPWFMTVFGRDSLIAAYEALPFRSELAQATLQALAELQATEWDDFADAQPGKIAHELRRGTLAALGEIPRVYYGSHDATALFLILLDEYESWTADRAFVRDLEPNARAALAWLEGPADLDGDGYLEYQKRSDSPTALARDPDAARPRRQGRQGAPLAAHP